MSGMVASLLSHSAKNAAKVEAHSRDGHTVGMAQPAWARLRCPVCAATDGQHSAVTICAPAVKAFIPHCAVCGVEAELLLGQPSAASPQQSVMAAGL